MFTKAALLELVDPSEQIDFNKKVDGKHLLITNKKFILDSKMFAIIPLNKITHISLSEAEKSGGFNLVINDLTMLFFNKEDASRR